MTTYTATRHGALCPNCNHDILPGQSCVWSWDLGGQLHETCPGEKR